MHQTKRLECKLSTETIRKSVKVTQLYADELVTMSDVMICKTNEKPCRKGGVEKSKETHQKASCPIICINILYTYTSSDIQSNSKLLSDSQWSVCGGFLCTFTITEAIPWNFLQKLFTNMKILGLFKSESCWLCCTQSYWVLELRPSNILKKKINVSEPASVSVFRRGNVVAPIQLGPLDIANRWILDDGQSPKSQ